jgi:hypothetical protein
MHPLRYVLAVAFIAIFVIAIVKTRQGEWLSFR